MNDFYPIACLLILYTLQGVPLGMSAVFPLLLKDQGASYSDLARFSFCSWPFALKLLWAPLVDATRFPGMGRRKSWLVPCQLAISALLYYLSLTYTELLDSKNFDQLTLIFFGMYFFAATQDIAVDGWALTMLSNVEHAGTCNSIGQTAGYFLAFSGFFGLSKLGICTLEVFMQIWAVIFLVVTLIVFLFVGEKQDIDTKSTFSIYGEMKSIIQLKPVMLLSTILLTAGIPFIDSLIGVKFQDSGVAPDVIALLATLTTPVHILLPWLVSRYASWLPPLDSYRVMFPLRLGFQLVSVALILLTPYAIAADSGLAVAFFYVIVLSLSMVESAVVQVMFVSQMNFFAKISDPLIGGTYMTVLNTISNIGGNIAKQLSYRLAQWGTSELVDGFYVVVVCATVYGIFWIKVFSPKIISLQRKHLKSWRVTASK